MAETDWRLLGRNAVTGVETWWLWNGDGTCTIRETQDVEPILDRNQELYNLNDGYDSERNFKRVASIPNVVLTEYRKKGINLLSPEFEPEMKRFLNDSDFRKLRTASGTL